MERLVHFWSNHFAVSVDKLLVIGLAGGFEADAIRPHVLGRFEDLLLAAVRHPAMLLYLDQARSAGPNSMAGARGRGLNENLAREILELHTLGVRSGYTQQDVTEFARALTGWTLPRDEGGDDASATFRFVPALHEPLTRTSRVNSVPAPRVPELLRYFSRPTRIAVRSISATAMASASACEPAGADRSRDTRRRTAGSAVVSSASWFCRLARRFCSQSGW
jgi:hypothetical protein